MADSAFAKNYDFIVVGGGSAGCLLARLLAESHCGSVALIEAGDSSGDIRTRVPAYYPRTFGSALDWRYATEPQAGLNGRRIAWPRGKTLGGSGAINALIYLQPAAGDFNRWSAAGCSGWDWQSLVRAMPEISNLCGRCPASGLPLSPIAQPHAWSLAFIEACTSYGLLHKRPWLQAANATCGAYSLMQSNGRRQHTGQQLAAKTQSEQLEVICGMTVQSLKVVSGRVTAVRLCDGSNRLVELRAGGEVILSAGAIGSPALLLRSGIGPADALRELGIAVQLDLPGVGENLQDHVVYPLIYRTGSSDGLPTRFCAADRRQFRSQGSGPLSSNLAEAGATFALTAGDCPDFQIHFTPTHYLKYPSRRAPTDHFSLAVSDLHPRSRGRVVLQCMDPQAPPSIDPGYFKHPEDSPRLIDAIAACREIARQPGLSELIVEETLPGSRRVEFPALARSVQMFAQSIYHPVGTCRMGSEALAVVDPSLKVHGLSNLHVVDASILPDLPSANTQAVTLLVAARKFSQLRTGQAITGAWSPFAPQKAR